MIELGASMASGWHKRRDGFQDFGIFDCAGHLDVVADDPIGPELCNPSMATGKARGDGEHGASLAVALNYTNGKHAVLVMAMAYSEYALLVAAQG
jgi:hypothetical protein